MSGFCLLLLYPVNVTAFTKASGSRSRISANKSWLYTQTYMFSLCFVRCLSIQLNCFKPQLPFIQLRWCCFIFFFLNVFSSELVTPPPPHFFQFITWLLHVDKKKKSNFCFKSSLIPPMMMDFHCVVFILCNEKKFATRDYKWVTWT